jgi:hypothetical protein
MATTRERLHELLDELPEYLLDDAEAAIAALAAPPFRPLSEVPEYDEPITPEEEEAIRLGLEEYQRGETIPHDQAMREMGLWVATSSGAAKPRRTLPSSHGENPGSPAAFATQ